MSYKTIYICNIYIYTYWYIYIHIFVYVDQYCIYTCTGIYSMKPWRCKEALGTSGWSLDWSVTIGWVQFTARNHVETMIYDVLQISKMHGECCGGSTFGKFSPCRPRKLWKKFTWVRNAELAYASFITVVIAEVVLGRTRFENKHSEETLMLYMPSGWKQCVRLVGFCKMGSGGVGWGVITSCIALLT